MIYKRTCKKVYANYGSYKPYIRYDFYYKCVYCHRHEGAFDSYREFQIDHVKPKSIPRFKHLVNDYSNLVYSCPHCNKMKTDLWPSDDPISEERGWIDPCQYDFDEHYELKYDGNDLKVIRHSPLGNWLVHHLGFDQQSRINNIAKWYNEVYKLRKIIIRLHRQSKCEDLSDDTRRAAADNCSDLLGVLRTKFFPEPYVPFHQAKSS